MNKVFDYLQSRAKANQKGKEKIKEIDLVRAFSVLQYLQIENVYDVLLSCVSLNLINTYVNQTRARINFKNKTIDLAKIIFENQIDGVKAIYRNRKSMLFFVFEKLQFSFGGIKKTNELFQYTSTESVAWDGIRKQKCALTLFELVWNNQDLHFQSKQADENIYSLVEQNVTDFEKGLFNYSEEQIDFTSNNKKELSDKNHLKNIKACVDNIAINANSGKPILIHDKLLEQMKNDKQYFERIFKELLQLSIAASYNSISDYLKNHNGKQMTGSGENVWKYRISKGDRLLYTFGKYIKGIRPEYKDAVVLIGYSKHEEQGRDAGRFKFGETEVTELNDYIADNTEEIIYEDEEEIKESVSQANYLSCHKLFSVDELSLVSVELEDSDVYLSDEQSACVDAFIYDPSPTLVLGGAGTGKTLIALHIINDFSICNESQRAAYFTQSYELRKSAEKRFDIISQTKENVCFEDINEFALKLLSRPLSDMANIVTQNRFVNELPLWIAENYRGGLKSQMLKIDPVSAWTEIRGIIKGQLGTEWNRFKPLSRNEIGNTFAVDYLIKNNWLKEWVPDKRCLIPFNSISLLSERLEYKEVENEYRKLIKEILSYFADVNTDCVDIGKETYCTLSEESSTVPYDKRELYWEIYQCYTKWIDENNYFDENDLAREALKKALNKKDKFDLIAVDEIQDYTEMQIYLLHSMSRDKINILYVGDGNQNVNPTLFRADHLNALYSNEACRLKTFCLHRDYRCPGSVVKLSNKLAKIRSEKIAKQHEEQEIALESVLEEGSVPYRLKHNDNNILLLLAEMAKYPSAIILVPDSDSKKHITLLAEKSGITELPIIHTVPEIKGMEYKYVLCYDIVGRYIDQWNNIMSPEHIRKQTGERYFFNLLYVGMTRSQMYLGFMDSETSEKLEDELSLRPEERFNAVQLHFTEMQNRPEDWLSTAEAYENVGNYEDAKRMYLKASAPIFVIRRCESQIARAEHNYDDAFRIALLSENEELVRDIVLHISEKSDLYPLATAMYDKSNCRFGNVPATENMSKYLEHYFSEFSENETEKAVNATMIAVGQSTNNQIDMLKEFFNNEQ